MYPGPFVSSFGSVIAVSQVVMEVKFLLVALYQEVVSTLGVVENGLIEASSVFPFEFPPAL